MPVVHRGRHACNMTRTPREQLSKEKSAEAVWGEMER